MGYRKGYNVWSDFCFKKVYVFRWGNFGKTCLHNHNKRQIRKRINIPTKVSETHQHIIHRKETQIHKDEWIFYTPSVITDT